MQTSGNIEELQNAIQLAAVRQSIDRELLKEQFILTCETYKPGNLLASKIKEIATSRNLVRLVAVTALGLTTGYFSKKIVVGISAIVLRRVIAAILEYGVVSLLTKNARVPVFFGRNTHKRLSE
jgi:hypothetical protein